MRPTTEEQIDPPMESPQLQGVVIITLPPSDNPSKGKTITSVFTLSDPSPSTHQPQQPQNQHNLSILSPPTSTPPDHRFFSFRKIFTNVLKMLLGFVGISLLASLIWNSAFHSDTLRRFRSENGNEEIRSYMFPLYPKLGSRQQIEIGNKMGKIVQRERLSSLEMVNDGVQAQRDVDVMAKSSASPLFPVRGNVYPDGLYYISLPVGNPPRPYYLDMDTGSDLTWIQCDAPCVSCSKGPNPLYKPTRRNILPSKDLLCAEVHDDEKPGYCVSESCQECVYEIEYADNSSSRGVLVKDKLQQMIDNGTVLNSDFVFGCASDQKGELSLSPSRTDGILGLSKAKISLPSQLAGQGIIRNVVAHCITNDKDSLGYMFLGDDFVPQWGMTWVPMLDSPSISFYQSKVVKINYGQLSLWPSEFGRTQVVFDSGSSYTYFPKEAYSGLVDSLESFLGGGLTLDESDPTLPVCWRANLPIRDLEDVKSFFKPLTLHFERKWWILRRTLQIPPEGYLILSDKGNVCLGILDGSEVHDGSTIILGDISLRGWLVVYDNVGQRIGWSRSDCAKPQSYDSDSLAFF